MKNQLKIILFFICVIFLLSNSFASHCHGRFINPFTDICWHCFFPLTIGKTTITPGQNPDTSNPGNPICHCGANPFKGWGLAVGYWAPSALIDVTRHPYCLVNLGGIALPQIKPTGQGDLDNAGQNNHSFYEFHYIAFPFMDFFSELIGGACLKENSFGFAFLSELDPAWHDEKLNAVLYPELAPVVSHIIASQAAQAADCVAASTHLSLDNIYWSAGCQGSLYPIEGEVQEHVHSVQATTLLSERAMLLLHRLGFIKDSSKHSLCHEHFKYYLPKSRYRYQMNYPVKKNCYPFGHTTMTWSANIIKPISSEDYGYIIWKKKNCCSY